MDAYFSKLEFRRAVFRGKAWIYMFVFFLSPVWVVDWRSCFGWLSRGRCQSRHSGCGGASTVTVEPILTLTVIVVSLDRAAGRPLWRVSSTLFSHIASDCILQVSFLSPLQVSFDPYWLGSSATWSIFNTGGFSQVSADCSWCPGWGRIKGHQTGVVKNLIHVTVRDVSFFFKGK